MVSGGACGGLCSSVGDRKAGGSPARRNRGDERSCHRRGRRVGWEVRIVTEKGLTPIIEHTIARGNLRHLCPGTGRGRASPYVFTSIICSRQKLDCARMYGA